VAEPHRLGRQPGWREVVLVAAAAAAIVLGAGVLTGLLPKEAQDIVTRTPIAIAVLTLGTGWLLWTISRRGPEPPE
jgi:hypothetical protein